MSESVVVTRHPGLVEYLREVGVIVGDVAVVTQATPDDVRGKDVIGVLPLSLAVLTNTITEVVLEVPRELRGTELTLSQVREYARGVVTYKVTILPR